MCIAVIRDSKFNTGALQGRHEHALNLLNRSRASVL
jgi:hypothetical protein